MTLSGVDLLAQIIGAIDVVSLGLVLDLAGVLPTLPVAREVAYSHMGALRFFPW